MSEAKLKLIRGLCPICFAVVEVPEPRETWECPGGHTVETYNGDEIPF